jgi:hypothetical protein
VETTYLLHLQVVLILTMVRSRPHHLRHQWPQISTFASLNHIHHHTYFKSSYVHIQVFHILHHYTMKLLQAFECCSLQRTSFCCQTVRPAASQFSLLISTIGLPGENDSNACNNFIE